MKVNGEAVTDAAVPPFPASPAFVVGAGCAGTFGRLRRASAAAIGCAAASPAGPQFVDALQQAGYLTNSQRTDGVHLLTDCRPVARKILRQRCDLRPNNPADGQYDCEREQQGGHRGGRARHPRPTQETHEGREHEAQQYCKRNRHERFARKIERGNHRHRDRERQQRDRKGISAAETRDPSELLSWSDIGRPPTGKTPDERQRSDARKGAVGHRRA